MTHMPWLPAKPENFRELVRGLVDEPRPGQSIQSLASHDLDESATAMLSRQILKVRASGRSIDPLSPFLLGVVGSSTFDLVAELLAAGGARHGVYIEHCLAPYDQVDRPMLKEGAARFHVEAAVERISTLATTLRDRGTSVILPIFATPPDYLFGHMDRRVKGSPRSMIEAFNQRVIELAQAQGHYLIDVATIAERVGVANWFSATSWNLYKLPFAPEFGPLFADAIGRIISAIRGKSRKCLVLDLDNTLWGGVVGDDGVEGLKIGQGSPEGEAHLAVQRLALDLRDRGIILAVCSKNFDETARRPFRELPDMLIKEADIAVFQANWVEKASNLEAIAKFLNIGVDALVFLDDNAAERAQMRAALPMVAVPELPADVSLFAPYLAASGLFESVAFSEEDLSRADSYAAEAQRAEVQASTRNLGDYLSALQMLLSHDTFDNIGRQRIAQLINKSNQFNLTTRRYTEPEIAELEEDPFVHTRQFRLRDRFGEFGMIGVIICRTVRHAGHSAWDIDTWLMSCRVLGRKVEEAMLQETVQSAKKVGVRFLLGRFIPTNKNSMVSEHYSRLGFARIPVAEETGSTLWLLDTQEFPRTDLPMQIVPR